MERSRGLRYRRGGYAEFDESEDEGACYAFDLGDGRLVLLVGQQFYSSARFPSLDFSVVYPLDENGASADMWLEKRGERMPPDHVIPAEVRWELAERLPESLDVVKGSLEGNLRRRSADGSHPESGGGGMAFGRCAASGEPSPGKEVRWTPHQMTMSLGQR